MSKFKVGDRVRVKDTPIVRAWNKKAIGFEATLTEIDMVGGDSASRHLDDNYWGINFKDEDLELVSNTPFTIDTFVQGVAENYKTKKTIMTNLITTFKNITRSEPNKTFVKAGVMHEDLSLTSEGQQLFIQFMFDKHAEEFKTDVVDKIIAEQEKK